MFNIKSQTLQMNRGDDIDFLFLLNVGTHMHPVKGFLEDGEAIYFGVMEPNQKWEEAVIRQKYVNDDVDDRGNVVIRLKSQDTEHLHPGTYYYQIKGYIKDVDKIVYEENETDYKFYRDITHFPQASETTLGMLILLYGIDTEYDRPKLTEYICELVGTEYKWVKGTTFYKIINSKEQYTRKDDGCFIVDDDTQEGSFVKYIIGREIVRMVTNTLTPKEKFVIYE